VGNGAWKGENGPAWPGAVLSPPFLGRIVVRSPEATFLQVPDPGGHNPVQLRLEPCSAVLSSIALRWPSHGFQDMDPSGLESLTHLISLIRRTFHHRQIW
jgi:hypothetical protein